MAYPFNEIEKKWQKHWADNKTFAAKNPSPEGTTELTDAKVASVAQKEGAPKYYALDMFPYPSGAGLHVGHPLGYIASDIVSRYKRLKGFNVLHPMGYDSFGLPAEQYAIQTGQHPEKTTKENIARYREQMDKIGFSFDWDREVRTSDPAYYRWTQWIFLKLFNSWYNPETDKAESINTLVEKLESGKVGKLEKKWVDLNEKEKSDVLMNYRLAYLSEAWVNWCPQMGTVLANEEVKDGVSERGGYPVERKLMPQWSLRITAYANRLLNDLDNIDWTESIKEAQRNWIGKSEGSSLRFHLSPGPSPQERGGSGESVVSEPMQEYYTTDGQMWNLLVDKAKSMRKNPTDAESALWESLRRNVAGHKARRQHIIDRFIVDFVFLSKLLVIEVDGDIHDFQKEEDEARTRALRSYGFRVIRFKNEEVVHDVDGVVAKIVNELNKLPDSASDIKVFKEDAEEYTLTSRIGNSSPSLEERGLGGEVIEVFTTRPDTIFGVTFLTLAPEHELVEKITTPENKKAVEEYIRYAKSRSERDRQADVKKITGQFTGAYAVNPFNGAKIPIWIGDYVLAGYGTGAVMAVPSSDERDYKFARQFGLKIIYVIEGTENLENPCEKLHGKLINSGFLNGLESHAAIKRCIQEIEKRGLGKGKTQFRLRDAIFGRQRYWGEPIPIYYKNGVPYAVDEKDLPIVLPEVDKYLPTESGEPPLARAKNWKYKPHPQPFSKGEGSKVLSFGEDLGEAYEFEKTTMPGWAGSSWYYLRYMDPQNKNEFASKDALNYWQNVDLYIGGAEHSTGHLLYVRFWTKFLFDLGLIPVVEPAKKLINQGMIQGMGAFVYRITTYELQSAEQNRSSVTTVNESTPIFISKKWRDKIMHQSLNETEKSFINDAISKECAKYKINNPEFVGKILYEGGIMSVRVDINLLNDDILNIDQFKKWRPEFSNAAFIAEEEGSFFCSREVEKMSKSKHNVVTPDDMCANFGADTLRLYEMFLGPLEQSKPWNTAGITGVFGFLNKFWRLFHLTPNPSPQGEGRRGEVDEAFFVSEDEPTRPELKILHKTIKKIQHDIENYSFNTSVSSFMIATNELTDLKCNKRAILEPMVILLSSFAPHIAEELWEKLGHKQSITFASFPQYNEALMTDDSFAYPISFNGKMRFNLELSLSLTPAEIEKEVLANEQSKKFLEGKQPKKVIVVPKRIVNIVM